MTAIVKQDKSFAMKINKPFSGPALSLPKNFGQSTEVPELKTWKVVDSNGAAHEIQAQGFNPAGDGRVDFFVIKQPVGSIIQSTELLQRTVCSFYHPAFITALETPKPEQN